MLFEVFQPHVRLGFDVLVEHVLIHDLDSILVPGIYILCFMMILSNHSEFLDLGHDDILEIVRLLDPLFIFPDPNVRARLGPEDVQRTVSPLFYLNCGLVFRVLSYILDDPLQWIAGGSKLVN